MKLNEINFRPKEVQPAYVPDETQERRHPEYHPVTSKAKGSHRVTPAGSTLDELEDLVRHFKTLKSFTPEEHQKVLRLVREILTKIHNTK